MEKIGTHRVFWLNTKEGIAEFDTFRHAFVRENHLSLCEDRDTIPEESYKRQRKTVPTGYAPDPIYHYFSSDQAVSDSMERWKISPSTPTNPPLTTHRHSPNAAVMQASQDSDYHFWAQTYMR